VSLLVPAERAGEKEGRGGGGGGGRGTGDGDNKAERSDSAAGREGGAAHDIYYVIIVQLATGHSVKDTPREYIFSSASVMLSRVTHPRYSLPRPKECSINSAAHDRRFGGPLL